MDVVIFTLKWTSPKTKSFELRTRNIIEIKYELLSWPTTRSLMYSSVLLVLLLLEASADDICIFWNENIRDNLRRKWMLLLLLLGFFCLRWFQWIFQRSYEWICDENFKIEIFLMRKRESAKNVRENVSDWSV